MSLAGGGISTIDSVLILIDTVMDGNYCADYQQSSVGGVSCHAHCAIGSNNKIHAI